MKRKKFNAVEFVNIVPDTGEKNAGKRMAAEVVQERQRG